MTGKVINKRDRGIQGEIMLVSLHTTIAYLNKIYRLYPEKKNVKDCLEI